MPLPCQKCEILHYGNNQPRYKYKINGRQTVKFDTFKDLGLSGLSAELGLGTQDIVTYYPTNQRGVWCYRAIFQHLMSCSFCNEPVNALLHRCRHARK